MKVQALNGLSFKSQTPVSINPYLYTYNTDYKKKSHFNEHKGQYIAGMLSLFTALFAITRLARVAIPKEIVEISNKSMGLNSVKGSKMLVQQLKEKILYPMKCVDFGETELKLKTGLILGADDSQKAEEFMEKFMEHAKEIGIKTVNLKNPKKANRITVVHKALDEAIKLHELENRCVIVHIDDLGKISNLNVSKVRCQSNLEKRLANMPKGVLWTAWTTDYQNLPYFYNNLPTLCAKL